MCCNVFAVDVASSVVMIELSTVWEKYKNFPVTFGMYFVCFQSSCGSVSSGGANWISAHSLGVHGGMVDVAVYMVVSNYIAIEPFGHTMAWISGLPFADSPIQGLVQHISSPSSLS